MLLTNPCKIITIIAAMAFAMLSFSIGSSAQVEIVNGSFEQSVGLPSSSGMWDMLDGWTNTGSTSANPDFYHMDGINGGDLPETPMAFIDAYDGRAIAGLEVCRRSGQNKREYLSLIHI